VTLSASSSQKAEVAFGPTRGILNMTEGKDTNGHLLAGGWVAEQHDASQYYQVFNIYHALV